jgi:hypothetical protein
MSIQKAVMTLADLKACNKKAVGQAVKGKKALVVPLLEGIRHIELHGDYTVIMPLIKEWQEAEVNLTHEAKAAIEWCVKYAGLEYSAEVKDFIGFKGQKFITDNFQAAKDHPYYMGISIAKEPEFDLDTEVSKLITRANNMMKVAAKAANDGKECKINVNVAHLEALKAIKVA